MFVSVCFTYLNHKLNWIDLRMTQPQGWWQMPSYLCNQVKETKWKQIWGFTTYKYQILINIFLSHVKKTELAWYMFHRNNISNKNSLLSGDTRFVILALSRVRELIALLGRDFIQKQSKYKINASLLVIKLYSTCRPTVDSMLTFSQCENPKSLITKRI